MYNLNYNTVFADYLSVTFNPDDNPSELIHFFLIRAGYTEIAHTPEKFEYRNPDNPDMGSILFECSNRTHWLQVRGQALEYLRHVSLLDELLSIIATTPHKVTRLDLAIQFTEKFSTAVRRYKRKYPKGHFQHGRATLAVSFNTRTFNDDLTGAVYLGDRKKRHDVSGIVYNKTFQVLDSAGLLVDPNITRYELRLTGRVGCSLKDVVSPEPVFYTHSSIFGLKKPSGVSDWVSGASYVPTFPSPNRKDHYPKLVDYLDMNPAFEHMLKLADKLPDGRRLLLNLLKEKIDSGT